MSRCLMKLPHKSGSCNSSDGLQVFENEDGSLTGFCFVCSTYVEDPLGAGKKASDLPKIKPKKTKEEIEEEFNLIADYKTVDLPSRRLSAKVLSHYGIKVGFNLEDGETPELVYFPYTKDGVIVRYKIRNLKTKKMWVYWSMTYPMLLVLSYTYYILKNF